MTVYDSVVDGEYLGWHSRNLRLVNCRISGTQALCYAENLVLENCTLGEDADLCFEYSSVHAEIKGRVHSVKIRAAAALLRKEYGDIILDEHCKAPANCSIETGKAQSGEAA